MLFKLALGNVRRAQRDYLVYLLTLVLGVTVFYAFNTMSEQLSFVPSGELIDQRTLDTLTKMLFYLTIFLACILGFLMVYANKFIMKRRKREFGLYQILGMGQRSAALMMTIETSLVSLVSIGVGLLCGVGLSQLMTFFTASMFQTQVANFHFFFSIHALITTVGCLVAVFVVTLLFNLRIVAKSKVIDLMSSQRGHEELKLRNPWVSAILCIVGLVLMGIAYIRLSHDKIPLRLTDDWGAFLLTTALVVAGTVLFFFGLSGLLLKILQAVRGIYWRGLNMFTLRELSVRINTVSMSMAVISLILFFALTSVTTGMSMARASLRESLRLSPMDYSLTSYYASPSLLTSIPHNQTDSPGQAQPVGNTDDCAGTIPSLR